MPLLIETYLKETPNKGIGLFTSIFLKKGTIIYRDDITIDKLIPDDIVEKYDEPFKSFVKSNASYIKKLNLWYVYTDNSRFFNHDDIPNTSYNKETGESITLIDINIGEELTSNYREFCDHCVDGNFGFEIK